MDDRPPADSGFLDGLRDLGATLIATVHDRLELLSVDVHEEKFRLIRIFVWISAAVFTGMLAVLFISLTLVYLFWESSRLAALGGFALVYTIAFCAIVAGFRRHIANQPRPFAATLGELQEDQTCIRTGN